MSAMNDATGGDSMRVREAREVYFATNGFSAAAYDAKWTKVAFFAFKFAIPNTARHAWGIRLHDLHHVATGYGTDLVGEGEISCWELAGGLRGLDLYVGSIIVMVALTGCLLSPRRMLRAWQRGRRARPLWTDPSLEERDDAKLEELLDLTVAELRDRTGVRRTKPVPARAAHARRTHAAT
jgi:hypothetical protein